jgi:phage FluMu protein gp41
MNAPPTSSSPPSPANDGAAAPLPKPEVRAKVKELLLKTPAFAQLPREKRDELAHNMALVADYLASPEGIAGHTLKGGLAADATPTARSLGPFDSIAEPPPAGDSYESASKKVSEIGKEKFEAGAANAGVRAAGAFMKQVKFVEFVSGLIDGVFHSIVSSSIEQMEAYAKLVSNVAMSLNQFRDENVSANQGRDHVVEQFPDVFSIGKDDFSDSPSPKLVLRDGVDEGAALKRVQQGLGGEGAALKSIDVSDAEVEARLVTAGRNQLATSRQQLLATLVMMGINRIVVTDGRISAKILFDFQTKDSRKLQRSAAAYDYARDQNNNLATTTDGEGKYDSGSQDTSSVNSGKDDYSSDRDANWYAKGEYKYTQKPVMTAMSTASDAQDNQLSVKAQLAGSVDVNFKSDYLPLEKMASPGMIAAIQMNSKPVDPNAPPAAAEKPRASTAAPATTAPAATS